MVKTGNIKISQQNLIQGEYRFNVSSGRFFSHSCPGKSCNEECLQGIWLGSAEINELKNCCPGDLPEVVGSRVDQTNFVSNGLVWVFWSSGKYLL